MWFKSYEDFHQLVRDTYIVSIVQTQGSWNKTQVTDPGTLARLFILLLVKYTDSSILIMYLTKNSHHANIFHHFGEQSYENHEDNTPHFIRSVGKPEAT